ncbi:MAG TPA: regulatory protein RecX [Vulgatibacter sp.]|nr:regulatory protein RecX [Vulgatibacter sp.]
MTSRSRGSERRRPPLGTSYDDALRRAYEQLARRARSEAEIRRKLLQEGADEAVVDRVVARLQELRYLDDDAFARARARGLAARGFGPLAARSKLALAGVPPHRIEAGVAEAFEREGALARQALARRLAGRPPGDLERKERERLLRWLAGRGFSPSAIRAAFAGDGRGATDPD